MAAGCWHLKRAQKNLQEIEKKFLRALSFQNNWSFLLGIEPKPIILKEQYHVID